MPILDLQRRLHQAGRIRIGQQVPASNGGTRPAKLSTFRLTSQDELAVRAAAGLFGGEPRRWEGAPVGEQWEVITEAKSINVVIPPAATAFSQWYEQWSGGGCVRRCDGQTEMLTDSPCLCAIEDERVCTPHSRLNVILADMPGIGVWRLDTSGWNAATELSGTVDVIMGAAARGQLLPAVLHLEQRQVKRPGEATKKFAVPVLDIAVTPSALGLVAGEQPALAARPDAWQSIPEPAGLPAADVSDAIRHAGTDGPKRRKNSAPEIPPTGLNPRGTPPADQASPPDEPVDPAASRRRTAMALFGKLGLGGDDKRDERLALTSALAGRPVGSWNDLDPDEADQVIDQLRLRLETRHVP